jgi:hypothetical protein
MKKLLIGLATLPFLAGVAMAGQPMSLNDAQMDKVTAGQALVLLPPSNLQTVTITDEESFYDPTAKGPTETITITAPEPGGNSAAPLNIQASFDGNLVVNVGIGTSQP